MGVRSTSKAAPLRELAFPLDARRRLVACEELRAGLTGPLVSTALPFGDGGAVGFSGVDLRRRVLLMLPATRTSRTTA